MDLKRVFRFRENARFFNFDDRSFVIDISDLSFYSLGRSSAIMAAAMNGKRDVSGVIDIVRQHYDVSPHEGAGAVERFIEMMLQKPLIEEVLLDQRKESLHGGQKNKI